MGSKLQMESQEEVGSRFWFYHPLKAVGSPVATPAALASTPPSAHQALRLLVVDDHPINRLLVPLQLQLQLQRNWSNALIVEVEDGVQAMHAMPRKLALT
jgi:hypothetical protein